MYAMHQAVILCMRGADYMTAAPAQSCKLQVTQRVRLYPLTAHAA